MGIPDPIAWLRANYHDPEWAIAEYRRKLRDQAIDPDRLLSESPPESPRVRYGYPDDPGTVDSPSGAKRLTTGTLDAFLNAACMISKPSKPPRKPAHVRFQMNETEARFAKLLDAGGWPWPVKGWEFETETLRLSPDMVLTPDFVLTLDTGMVDMIDCKGNHVWDDSVAKGKAAAVIFPHRRYFLAKLTKGQWRVRQLGVKGRKTIILEEPI